MHYEEYESYFHKKWAFYFVLFSTIVYFFLKTVAILCLKNTKILFYCEILLLFVT